MLVRETVFGHIVWLTEEEINCQNVRQELERLKSQGKVAVFCSGGMEPMLVINKLLQENKELIDS